MALIWGILVFVIHLAVFMFPKNLLTFKKHILWQCLNMSHFAEIKWQRGLQLA